MVLSRLTKITGPGIRTDTNWVGNNANYTGILTAASLGGIGNITATGIITASSFSGNVTAVDGTFSGNVSIGGTLTYEDVTNVDSVGLITARLGVDLPGGQITVGNNIKLGNAGVITATSFVGSGAALTGIDATSIKDSGGNVKIQAQASGAVYTGIHTFNSDLDVDGHTNLDNVSIAGLATVNQLRLADNKYLQIGNSQDLQLYHDGNNSYVNEGGTGSLFIAGSALRIQSDDNRLNDANGNVIIKTDATSAYLYHEGSNRLNTTSAGINIPQDLDVDGHTNLDNVSIAGVTTFSGDIATQTIFPQTNNSKDIGSSSLRFRDLYLSNDLSLIDTGLLKLGNSNDFLMQHSGTHNFIEGGSGFSGNLYLRAKLNQEGVKIVSDGAVEISHSGTKKFETNSGGIGITGNIQVSGTVDGVDIAALNTTVGTKLANVVEDTSPQLGGDLYSNGRHIRMDNQKYVFFGTDGFGIAGYSSNQVYFEGNSTGQTLFIRPKLNQESIKAIPNGAVLLHHSGNQKLTTESDGVTVSGLMEASRTRNVPITTTERNALGTPDEGTMIYNSTLKKLQVYTDGAWLSFSGKIITTGGGTVSNDSNRSGYVTHTFTSPGTFNTDAALEGVEIMVVGGGGGGGGHRYGSGGGAGGVIMRPASPAYPINSPAPVVVGAGGAGAPNNGTGSNGSNSTFGTGPTQLIGKGGGGGTSFDGPVYPGRPGGSGAGGTSRPPSAGGSATQPGTHGAGTDYGNRGGNYANGLGGGWAPGGGGGAGGQGADTPNQVPGGGNGGVGVQLSISGSATYYAGGGAAGIYNNLTGPSNHQGVGGNGGGGSSNNSVPGSPGHSAPGTGATNSGGGGCGAHGQNYAPGQNATSTGKAGGSGIVIVAYPLTQPGGEIVVS